VRIDQVDLMIVPMPLVRPFQTSSTRRWTLSHILVKVTAGDDVGWGESACTPEPTYCEETTETCWHLLRDHLAPAVVGRSWNEIDALTSLYGKIRRNHFAKAGLETACWDLLSRSRGVSLAAFLGGTRGEILSGVSLGIEASRERLFDQIAGYREEGYRRVKLKIAPGRDVAVVRDVRERFPDLPLLVDANAAYRPSEADALRRLDAFDLMMIEQPFAPDDLRAHAAVQRELRTPICLDESIHSLHRAEEALALGSCRIVNVKVGRLGGLLEAKRVHDLCLARGVPVWCGGMHEYGIGRAANLALASLPGFTIPGDVCGSDKSYAEDLVDPPIRAVNGAIAVPIGPGLGFRVDEDRIARLAERTARISAD